MQEVFGGKHIEVKHVERGVPEENVEVSKTEIVSKE